MLVSARLLLACAILFTISQSIRAEYNCDTESCDPGRTTDPNIQEICSLLPPNEYILRPHTCTNWIQCPSTADGMDYKEGACVAGLFFNKDACRCDNEENVQCPYVITQKNRCEDKRFGFFLSDPDCRGYTYCKNGKELQEKCPRGEVYNPKKNDCVNSQDYKCPSINHKAKTLCRSIASHQLFASEEDCTNYHECDDDILLTHECDIDMAFDYTKGHCVSDDNVICHPKAEKPLPTRQICGVDGNPRFGYYPDGQSCSGYYFCSRQSDKKADRHPTHMKCDPDYFFDETKGYCHDRFDVHCSLDRCENMGDNYVSIAGDCSAFAICDDGITVSTDQCPKNLFFDERTQSCMPRKYFNDNVCVIP